MNEDENIYTDVDFDDILFTDGRQRCKECLAVGFHKMSCSECKFKENEND